jgi:hypothetical protein
MFYNSTFGYKVSLYYWILFQFKDPQIRGTKWTANSNFYVLNVPCKGTPTNYYLLNRSCPVAMFAPLWSLNSSCTQGACAVNSMDRYGPETTDLNFRKSLIPMFRHIAIGNGNLAHVR